MVKTPANTLPVLAGGLQDNHNVGIRVLGYALQGRDCLRPTIGAPREVRAPLR